MKFLLSPVVLPRWVAAAAVAIVLVPVLQDPAAAAPGPSRRELTAQQKKLGDQLEKITEQYNGLRLQLTQAKRAAKSAVIGGTQGSPPRIGAFPGALVRCRRGHFWRSGCGSRNAPPTRSQQVANDLVPGSRSGRFQPG